VKDHTDPLLGRRTLLVNAAANGAAFILQLAAAFLLAPILVRHLGRERYGVWSFVESFLAYFTLFDLGIAATLVRYVPKFRAEGDHAQLGRVVSACLLVFCGAGVLTLLLGAAVFGTVLSASPKIPPALRPEAAGLALVSVLSLAISLPLSVYSAILDGLGRFTAKNCVRSLFLLLRVGGMLTAVWCRLGLVSLAAIVALSALGEQILMAWLVARLLPDLRPAPWRADPATLRLIRGYSVDSFLAMLAGRISFKTDAIVIGLCGQLDMIPFFDMPSRLVEYAKNLIRSGTTTLTPAFSAMEARGGTTAIRALFLNGCRYAIYLALPIQVAFLLFGGAFLELWLGDHAFRVHGEPVLWILASAMGMAMMQSVAARVLYGLGRIRSFARLMLLEALLNLGLSVVLIRPLGLVGVALGTAIPNLVMCVVVLVQVCRLLEVGTVVFLKEAVRRPAFLATGLLVAWLGLVRVLPPESRLSLAVLIAAGAVPYALATADVEIGWLRGSRLRRVLPAFSQLKE
jgi:O-antigen/teichoic acid export membrane protein